LLVFDTGNLEARGVIAKRKRVIKTRRRRAATVTPKKHVVYVHGICPHKPGYSDAWWKAMKRYVPSVTDRHEVIWSDLVAMPMKISVDPKLAIEKKAIADVLVDRAQREVNDALRTRSRAASGLGVAVETRSIVQTQAFLGLPGIECIDDFLKYAYQDRVRDKVIRRFTDVVRPLLDDGDLVEVISHSWGTVVAYEGLRLLDEQAGLADHALHTLFTVGSALSIPTVRRWLRPAPHVEPIRIVQNWVNLDARFDIVGGSLKGWFGVSVENLELDPIGCPGLVPSFTCAHSSYFNGTNTAVNRDIFGSYIEG
jgi:metacaspase-1